MLLRKAARRRAADGARKRGLTFRAFVRSHRRSGGWPIRTVGGAIMVPRGWAGLRRRTQARDWLFNGEYDYFYQFSPQRADPHLADSPCRSPRKSDRHRVHLGGAAHGARSGAGPSGSRADGAAARLPDHGLRQVAVPAAEEGRQEPGELEGGAVEGIEAADREDRRPRPPDQDQPRPRVPRRGEQGSVHAPVPRPRGGSHGPRTADLQQGEAGTEPGEQGGA